MSVALFDPKGSACVEVMWCCAFVEKCPYCGYYVDFEFFEAVMDLAQYDLVIFEVQNAGGKAMKTSRAFF